MHTLRKDCRLCHSANVEKVLSLAPTPPANELLTDAAQAATQDTFPLDLYFCNECYHLQLLNVVDPERLFRNYVYVSGTSPSFRAHFHHYAEHVIEEFSIAKDSLVVDVGSNDGTLLSSFKSLGMRVQGVDPAEKIAAEATANGIDTIGDFFTQRLAEQIKQQKGSAKVVVANNVFAHIDNLHEILFAVDKVLDDAGIFCIEVSYLKDVIENTLFDTIYHEHLDYHAVAPLKTFFANNGFELIHVESVSSHGGSLRAMAQKQNGPHAVRPSVEAFIAAEQSLGLLKAQTFKDFAAKINTLGDNLQTLVSNIKGEGKHIAAFGLPAKATTLMHQFKIGGDIIDYVVDDNPLKQGLYSPGYGIPIHNSEYLQAYTPDYIIILAWNFADPIIEKLQWFIEAGGQVIVPVPELKIVSKQ